MVTLPTAINCFVGIDQHKHYSQVAVKDKEGTVLNECRLQHDNLDGLRAYFERFDAGSTDIALEATGSYYWLVDLLESLNLSVKLAHPLKVKMIAESTIKTDQIDAKTLADLLRTNFLPTAYIPPQETRALRERLRHRIVLVHLRTTLKNRIEAVLTKLGVTKPRSNLYSAEGKHWLRGLELTEPYQLEINNYLKLIEQLTETVKALDRQIKRYLDQDKRAEYLMSIPGIGQYTAYLILAEIGDINRFASAKKLTSYAGLVPSVNQSGKHIYFGHITKQGDSYLRCALVEAAYVTIKYDYCLGDKYRRLKAAKGSNKAIVAIARELLEIVYGVLKGERYYYRKYKTEDFRRVQR
jgi:transposase